MLPSPTAGRRLACYLAPLALIYLGAFRWADACVYVILAKASLGCAALLGVVALSRLLKGWRQQRLDYLGVALLAVLFTALPAVGLSIPLKSNYDRAAVQAAMAFPAGIAPLLADYYQQHGRYPAALSELSPAPEPPRLLQKTWLAKVMAYWAGYESDGQSYLFTFATPFSLTPNIIVYDSLSGSWRGGVIGRDAAPGPVRDRPTDRSDEMAPDAG